MKSQFNTQAVSSQEDELSRVIPFSYSLTEEIVVTKSGDYLSTWLIEGLSFEGLSDDQALVRMDSFNMLIRSLSNGKFAFWVHRIRRAIADSLALPPEGFARDFMDKYYAGLEAGGLTATQIYLTVLYRPYPQRHRGVIGGVARNAAAFAAENDAAVDMMDSVHRQVMSTLNEYRPTVLGAFDSGGVHFSDQLTFYAFLINGTWRPIPLKRVPLDKYLGRARMFFGYEMLETRDEHGSIFSAFVDIKDYADYSSPGVLNTMLGLGCEYIETQSFSPMSVRDAQEALKRQKRRLISSEDNAQSQVVEIDSAIDKVLSGEFSFGEYHYTIQVRGASPERVKVARAAAIDALQNVGFLGVPVDLVTDHAYAAQLPGNWRSRPRVANLSSRNFTGLSSMHNYSSGKRTGNPWGEAVAICKSPSGQPVYLNLHATDRDTDAFDEQALGNTQIIGQSGGGKTVLAVFIYYNLMKFGTQMVVFDKDRGMEIAVRAVGGQYLSLERGRVSGFAPFKMEPTEKTMLFWGDLIAFCARDHGRNPTAKEEGEIRAAVLALAKLDRKDRSFQTLIQNLPGTDENSISARLRKWCRTGPMPGHLGWALDSADDILTFEPGRSYGFDYTELLDDAATCPAIMMYLMHRVEELIDGRRFAFFMDEYWKALSVSYFEDFAKNKQKTIRKQNGLGVYMTQSPSDALSSPIAKTLIEQTATFIFLPNESADEKEYTEGFKLSKAEFEVVRSLKKGSRLFAIKQGGRFSLASLDLHAFSKEMRVISGTTANVNRLDKLRSRLGDDPKNWLTPFMSGELS